MYTEETPRTEQAQPADKFIAKLPSGEVLTLLAFNEAHAFRLAVTMSGGQIPRTIGRVKSNTPA